MKWQGGWANATIYAFVNYSEPVNQHALGATKQTSQKYTSISRTKHANNWIIHYNLFSSGGSSSNCSSIYTQNILSKLWFQRTYIECYTYVSKQLLPQFRCIAVSLYVSRAQYKYCILCTVYRQTLCTFLEANLFMLHRLRTVLKQKELMLFFALCQYTCGSSAMVLSIYGFVFLQTEHYLFSNVC